MPDNSGAEINLSDVSPKDKPWDVHRTSASEVQALYDGGEFAQYARRIAQCSRQLDFAIMAAEHGEENLKLKFAKFCRVRHCPVCQWRRALMWKARMFKAMPMAKRDHPSTRWVFLTLTVKNCELLDLRSTIGVMNKAFTRMSQRKKWPGIGWTKALEVTAVFDCYYNSKFMGRHGSTWVKKWEEEHKGKTLDLELTNEVHPHFHILMMVKPSYFSHGYLSQATWREYWQSCLRVDYLPVVNIKTVKPLKGEDGDESERIEGAIQEALKYSVKPSDLVVDRHWLEELTKQLYKVKAISVGGVLSNYIDEDEPENLTNVETEQDDEDLVDTGKKIRFVWKDGKRRYTKDGTYD
jgi:plasmid rolling circle replication initiator protein Rep